MKSNEDTGHSVPFRKVEWLPRDIAVERDDDGTVRLKSRIPLAPYYDHLPASLARWAAEAPDRVWLAQRAGPRREWRKLSYGEAKRIVDALTQALLDLKIEGLPVALLSGNSIEHALMTQAAMQARLPAAPVSPAYSLMDEDYSKLRHVFDLIRPGVVMVQDAALFEKALAALDLTGVTVVHVDGPGEKVSSVGFAELASTAVTSAVSRSIAAITPQTVGKLLFTSGSTGVPKAVINTQEMMCANAAMMNQARSRSLTEPPPTIVDWMPWNHSMCGNGTFNSLLVEGGTFYIDDGRPVMGGFAETIRNLREISPTYYANVPAGYAALITAMEKDEVLCQTFFRDLLMLATGGARLPDDLHDRMQALAIRTVGRRIVFYTGWGSTETAPTATSTYWDTELVGLIGLPLPGVELKMVPIDQRYELRVRGVNVTPGYLGQPELTAKAFDEEGFFRIGDAGTFVDPDDPAQGIRFAGRVAEDFKLATGTFVLVGSLRLDAVLAAAPVVKDALIAGSDRPFIGLLAWPDLPACRDLIGDPDASYQEVTRHPAIIERLSSGLRTHNSNAGGASSRTIGRAIFLVDPPVGEEITEKGYINQRTGLSRRAEFVERLYTDPPDDAVIILHDSSSL